MYRKYLMDKWMQNREVLGQFLALALDQAYQSPHTHTNSDEIQEVLRTCCIVKQSVIAEKGVQKDEFLGKGQCA